MNHYCARIDFGGKTKIVFRLRAPAEVGRGTKENIILKDKDIADFKNFFHSLKLPIETPTGSGNMSIKYKNAGELWLEHSNHLRFNGIVFDPRALERRMEGKNSDPASDDWLNLFKGWKVSKYMAAKLAWQLYNRFLRPDLDNVLYYDVRPIAGWYHLEFVDKSNLHLYADSKVGDIVTVYTALPGNPHVPGPPWKYNPFWPEHLKLIEQLHSYNFCYFFRNVPDKYRGMDLSDVPEDPDERAHFFLDLWFGRPDEPAAEAGVSAAPILQWIWHCLARKNSELYNYIMNWLSSWRQMITDAPDTCLVMRSECGSGKSSFVSMLGSLVGTDYYRAVNDAEDVLGYFTSELGNILLLFLDEVKISNESQVRKLKQLLTSDDVRVRRMQSNAAQERKFFGVIMAGNTHQLLPADPGERRFVFLELPMAVSNCKNYLCKFISSIRFLLIFN